MSKHKSEDYKLNAVEYYLIGDITQEKVCKIFKCSVRSLLRWTEKYLDNGEIKRKNHEPIAYKIKKEHVKFILEGIKRNKTITLNELLLNLKNKFMKLKISKVHLWRIIKDNNITLKFRRLRHEPEKRFGKDINVNEKLKEFYSEIKKHKLKDIICVDETSISALQIRQFCYSEIGKRCIIKTKSQEVFKKYTAIFAISHKGVIGWKLYEKSGIDTNRLRDFIKESITDKYKNKIIILDNASSHRNEIIKNLINKKNKLLYSIPYQHYTNSIEIFFSILKSKLRKLNGFSYDNLKHNIKVAIKSIPNEYYMKMLKYSYKRDNNYCKNKLKKKKESKKYKE